MSEIQKENIIFISDAHEQFYYENLERFGGYVDEERIALIYCLGINYDTRRMLDRIYDFENRVIKPECLEEGWQTGGSMKVTRMAFNLYCSGAPSIGRYKKHSDQLSESIAYCPDNLFCCEYAPYFWQAIKLRYPWYIKDYRKINEAFGGRD